MSVREDGLTAIEVGTILSHKTKRGMVEFVLNNEKTIWDLDKAREIHGMIGSAIEAAISDELLYRFLTEKCDIKEAAAVVALRDFRELRQGSRETVYHN